MISIVQYLFEVSRWKEEAVKGNLSNKALTTLSKVGIRKPVLKYIAGINTGTNNIRKKAGAVNYPYQLSTLGVNKSKGEDIEHRVMDKTLYISNIKGVGYQTRRDPRNEKRLATYYPNKKHSNLADSTGMTDRHEAIEAKEFVKNKIDTPTFNGHANRQPLAVEMKERHRLNSLYPHLKNHEFYKSQLFDDRKPQEENVKVNSSRKNKKLDITDLETTKKFLKSWGKNDFNHSVFE